MLRGLTIRALFALLVASVCGCDRRPTPTDGAAGPRPRPAPSPSVRAQALPLRLPEPPPRPGAKAYVWCLRADVYDRPSEVDSDVLALLPLGSVLRLAEVRGEWVRAKVLAGSERPVTGWIHRSVITDLAADVDAVRRTGLVPRAVFVLRGIESPTDWRGLMLGSHLGVVGKPGDKAIRQVLLSDGQCLWPADSMALRSMRALPLDRVGLAPIDGPQGNTLYWSYGEGAPVPLRSALADALAAPPARPPGVLAFRVAADLCPEPVDVAMLPVGGTDEVAAVLDRQCGVVLLRPHPIRGAVPAGRLARAGRAPHVLGAFRTMLVVGYAGDASELVFYRMGARGQWAEDRVQALPSAPSAILGTPDCIYVGMVDGRLLALDKDLNQVGGLRLPTGPVRQIEAHGRGLSVACAAGGLRFVHVARSGGFGKVLRASDWGVVDGFVSFTEGATRRVALLGGKEGVRLAPKSRGAAPVGLVGSERGPTAVAGDTPSGGLTMASPGGRRALLLVGLGDRGIRVLAGATAERLRPVRDVPVPCRRMAWGREFLVTTAAGKVWFVSVSELVPSDDTHGQYALHGDTQVRVVGKRVSIEKATCHGAFMVRESLAEACRRGACAGTGVLPSGLTVVQRQGGLLCLGSAWVSQGKLAPFRPNARVTVGRGGAHLWGETRQPGDVFLLDEFSQPIFVGRWAGMP